MSVTHRTPARVAGLSLGLIALALAAPAMAQPEVEPAQVMSEAAIAFSIPAQALEEALIEFGRQSRQELFYNGQDVSGKTSSGVSGSMGRAAAMTALLAGTGLEFEQTASGGMMIGDRVTLDAQRASRAEIGAVPSATAAPLVAQAAAADIDPGVSTTGEPTTESVATQRRDGIEEIIITAQKREERLQDVPIAISAFTSDDLAAQKIEGGFDLMKSIPNLTFSKSNFTSYNLSIRGVGTKAVSATTDPGVAVSFNSVAIIQNRFFEQEYFDVERVEVLRGPQGTLYGRNATAGVVNLISAKPEFGQFSGSLKGEVGNYASKRMTGMLNVPLWSDVLALRLAGSMTARDGYDYNSVTQNAVNGRDLWSGRVSLGFAPMPSFRANFIWEHFNEDDNRSRTGKQLCHRDDGLTTVGDTPVVTDATDPIDALARPAVFSTGCKAGSLYDDAAFGTPNGLALPFVMSMIYNAAGWPWGHIPDPNNPGGTIGVNLLQIRDPYAGLMQSRDLRQIASFRDPVYRAEADLFQLNVDFDLTDTLTLTSQSAYIEDGVYSFQDFNRFNTTPFFRDTNQFNADSPFRDAAPGGIFCDPQLGCSNTMAGFDVSRADAKQFTQELRLASTFDGPVNFSIGANYTSFEGLNQYYVMNNVLTALAMSIPFNGAGSWDVCAVSGPLSAPLADVPMEDPRALCPYIDPNPVESINGDGHNYFRSVNPFEIRSMAAFGELYWNIDPALKLTAGLRYTRDRKTFTPVPTQLLLAPTGIGGGRVPRGYPADPDIVQEWGEFTGRLGVDWKPELAFTDETLVYAFYSRGYKGGGANPPTPDFGTWEDIFAGGGLSQGDYDFLTMAGVPPPLSLNGKEYGSTFKPEFVNAFEIGTKNTLMGGKLMLNAHAFYYDYADYQVSQIRNRTSVNENFDADIWGFELQTIFQPTPAVRVDANVGYLRTRIGDGEGSIDIMNRDLGNPDFVVVKSWAQIPANCVVPVGVAEDWAASNGGLVNYFTICGGAGGILNLAGTRPTDPATGQPFDFANYPELNGGSGFTTELSGNELPNAPRWTANIGAQYTMLLPGGDWSATLRGDAYWQDQSWHRVYNYAPYDRLKGWHNYNLSLWFDGPDNLRLEIYAKNLSNETPITDAFLNSDDAGLTTNVFTLDPRLIGISMRKDF
jgi:iron complex outermembrane receptor protein